MGTLSWTEILVYIFRLGSSECNVLNSPLCFKLSPCSGKILLPVLRLEPSFLPVFTSSGSFPHPEMQLLSLRPPVHIWCQQRAVVLQKCRRSVGSEQPGQLQRIEIAERTSPLGRRLFKMLHKRKQTEKTKHKCKNHRPSLGKAAEGHTLSAGMGGS